MAEVGEGECKAQKVSGGEEESDGDDIGSDGEQENDAAAPAQARAFNFAQLLTGTGSWDSRYGAAREQTAASVPIPPT